MKLELFVNVSSSKRIFASQYTKTGIPFYRGKEITLLQNKNKINESLFIDEFIYKNFLEKYNVPQFEDIFVTAVGTIGSIYISDGHNFYFKDGNIIWLNQYDRSKIVPKYLYYYLTSYMGQSHLNSLLIGSSQQAITIDKLKSIDIRLPNLKLQQHIVDTIHHLRFSLTFLLLSFLILLILQIILAIQVKFF
ncbi:Type I restriction modification DNA specificity domain [Acholeplasma oculi]|uniref:restriction endonuclease subunit S n=1 Tax=Acholeplasma oculi TaxID=35623 RepID=UPI0009A6754E|nr:restriction endonuclease subunit S [Acholeplasma oculi]SKC35802.1 Type I restriction modification DNA specificity domain-containing protein [Acholeplasma oculi]SUT90283.1 Type I restriction modification DNA specificity domain [Acholeplasma oculi]